MCRILLANKKGMDLIEKLYGMKNLMDMLEVACGGHGNGVAVKTIDDEIFIEKGMLFDNGLVVDYINNIEETEGELEWMLYHTRIASLGSKSDANCHPFVSGEYILSMNGTERSFAGLSELLKITDTEAILKCIDKFGLDHKKILCDLSSNFIGFKGTTPFVTSPNTAYKSYDVVNSDGAIIIASQLPKEFDPLMRVPEESPFYWEDGMELKTKKKPKAFSYVNPNNYKANNYQTSASNIPWTTKDAETKTKSAKDQAAKWRETLVEPEESSTEGFEGHILSDSEKKRMLEYIDSQKVSRNS